VPRDQPFPAKAWRKRRCLGKACGCWGAYFERAFLKGAGFAVRGSRTFWAGVFHWTFYQCSSLWRVLVLRCMKVQCHLTSDSPLMLSSQSASQRAIGAGHPPRRVKVETRARDLLHVTRKTKWKIANRHKLKKERVVGRAFGPLGLGEAILQRQWG
jgi:hypothetical protein